MKKKLLIILLVGIICIPLIGCSKNNGTDINQLNEIEGVSMDIKEGTLTKTSATIVITDVSGSENTFGSWYRIDKKENGKWQELRELEERNFTSMGYLVDDNNQLEMECNWERGYGQLEPGEYRLVKSIYDRETKSNKYFSVEFEIY